MTRAAITFDSGALIALERRKERAMRVYTHARDRGLVVATPNITLAEWWRSRTDQREAILRGILVEPATDETMKLAGVALGKVRAWRNDRGRDRGRLRGPANRHRLHERRRRLRGAESVLPGASCTRGVICATQGPSVRTLQRASWPFA